MTVWIRCTVTSSDTAAVSPVPLKIDTFAFSVGLKALHKQKPPFQLLGPGKFHLLVALRNNMVIDYAFLLRNYGAAGLAIKFAT